MRNAICVLLAACGLFGAGMAMAQFDAERFGTYSSEAPDLDLPRQPSSLTIFSGPEMAIYKPEGAGPFPAIVLVHACGGLRDGPWQNMQILDWAREAAARGYVVLVVDSLGPRGVQTVCMGAKNGVNFGRGAKDAIQAAARLRALPYVDKNRVALAGYSWGAMVGLLVASRQVATALDPSARFNAVVSLYPGCFTLRNPATGRSLEVVYPDIDIPVLVLMGETDTETPPSDCVPRLEALKSAGAPVQWHLYPGVGHCWDCENLNGLSKTTVRGTYVVYRYDKAATQDSKRRAFDFLQQSMGAR